MGKMSNGATYYGPDGWQEYVDAFWNPEQWLNSPWTKEKQTAFNDLYDFGAFGWYPFRNEFDKILNERTNDLYMAANYLDYSDIKDPRKPNLTSAVRILGSSVNFVSSNIKRLYE